MKRALKILACAALACGCTLMGGCTEKRTVSGEMHYNEWGTEYGVRVDVEVQKDRISKVTVAESDYVAASPEMPGWNPAAWNEGLDKLLAAYRGEYVSDILAKEVVTENGKPLVKGDKGFIDYGDEFIITGATLGSGRLLIAVQNALRKL